MNLPLLRKGRYPGFEPGPGDICRQPAEPKALLLLPQSPMLTRLHQYRQFFSKKLSMLKNFWFLASQNATSVLMKKLKEDILASLETLRTTFFCLAVFCMKTITKKCKLFINVIIKNSFSIYEDNQLLAFAEDYLLGL